MIEIIERSLVVPSSATPNHGIWLSNFDLLVARSHTPTVYFYRSNNAPGFFSVEPLKNALGKVLVPFYPLAGRLGVDQTGRVEIKCSGDGVLFLVARSDLKIDDFGDFKPSDEMRNMLVPNVENGDVPLVMFQLTFFKCGGVCLGAAVHHTAADGLAALHFVNTWSDIARGIANISVPPSLDRAILKAHSTPNILFNHSEYSPKPLTTSATKIPFVSAHLKLSKNQILKLKTEGLSDPKKPLSTFKAVVAHVWKSACKARSLGPDQESCLIMTADARARMQPPLPPGFLGNAIFRTSAVAAAGDILSNTLEYGANKITEATKKLDGTYIGSLIDYLETLNDVKELQKGKWVMPKSDLWVISWQGLPIYDADFGWGKPIFMGRACLQFSGLVYVMQDPGTEGGLTLAVAFEPESMDEFKSAFYAKL